MEDVSRDLVADVSCVIVKVCRQVVDSSSFKLPCKAPSQFKAPDPLPSPAGAREHIVNAMGLDRATEKAYLYSETW